MFSSVQLISRVQLFATPWIAGHQASLSIANSRSPPKPMFIVLAMPSNHLILCHPLLLLPSIFPRIRVFSNKSALHIRWPKYWSLGFSISPSKEHPGLISFRMDWLDLLAVQGTLKALLQHHSSKASILLHSAFFIVHLFLFIYCFIFGLLGLCCWARAVSSCDEQVSHCGGFSCCRAWILGHVGFSSCSMWVQLQFLGSKSTLNSCGT